MLSNILITMLFFKYTSAAQYETIFTTTNIDDIPDEIKAPIYLHRLDEDPQHEVNCFKQNRNPEHGAGQAVNEAINKFSVLRVREAKDTDEHKWGGLLSRFINFENRDQFKAKDIAHFNRQHNSPHNRCDNCHAFINMLNQIGFELDQDLKCFRSSKSELDKLEEEFSKRAKKIEQMVDGPIVVPTVDGQALTRKQKSMMARPAVVRKEHANEFLNEMMSMFETFIGSNEKIFGKLKYFGTPTYTDVWQPKLRIRIPPPTSTTDSKWIDFQTSIKVDHNTGRIFFPTLTGAQGYIFSDPFSADTIFPSTFSDNIYLHRHLYNFLEENIAGFQNFCRRSVEVTDTNGQRVVINQGCPVGHIRTFTTLIDTNIKNKLPALISEYKTNIYPKVTKFMEQVESASKIFAYSLVHMNNKWVGEEAHEVISKEVEALTAEHAKIRKELLEKREAGEAIQTQIDVAIKELNDLKAKHGDKSAPAPEATPVPAVQTSTAETQTDGTAQVGSATSNPPMPGAAPVDPNTAPVATPLPAVTPVATPLPAAAPAPAGLSTTPAVTPVAAPAAAGNATPKGKGKKGGKGKQKKASISTQTTS